MDSAEDSNVCGVVESKKDIGIGRRMGRDLYGAGEADIFEADEFSKNLRIEQMMSHVHSVGSRALDMGEIKYQSQ